MPGYTVNWKIVFLLLLEEVPASQHDKITHFSRQMPVHMETMKLALLLLMLSAYLVDFVSARGVAMVGKAGNREASPDKKHQKTFI